MQDVVANIERQIPSKNTYGLLTNGIVIEILEKTTLTARSPLAWELVILDVK